MLAFTADQFVFTKITRALEALVRGKPTAKVLTELFASRLRVHTR